MSQVEDPAEREAEAVAARVVSRAPVPATTAATGAGHAATSTQPPPKSLSVPEVAPSLEAYITGVSGGEPLSDTVRQQIEPHLGSDLTGVRVHSDPAAAAAAEQLQARAFTYGRDVFLGAGESSADLALMAHEATHAVQQGAVDVLRQPPGDVLHEEKPAPTPTPTPTPTADSLLPHFVLEAIHIASSTIPGFTLLTQLLGQDPLTGSAVRTDPERLVESLLTFVPALFAPALGPQLSTIGVLADVVRLITDGLAAHDLTLTRLSREVATARSEFTLVKAIEGNIAIVERHVSAVVADVRSFVFDLAQAVVEAVRAVAAGLANPLLESERIAPLWNLTKKVLGSDPLTGDDVDAPTVEILGDFLRLIHRGDVADQMVERGTLQQTADWLDTQLATFQALGSELTALFREGWAAIQPQNLGQLAENLGALVDAAFRLVGRVTDFAGTVLGAVLDLVKDSLLGWLSRQGHQLPGFELLTVLLGQDPFTGRPVQRTPQTLVRGFVLLLPGGEQTYDQLAESGVIEQAAAHIDTALGTLGISLDAVTGLFLGIWDTVTLESLLDPVATATRVLDTFGEPLGRLAAFAGVVVHEVLTLILGTMNVPAELLGSILEKADHAAGDIVENPVGFLVNMLGALGSGFSGFLEHISGYLTAGLADWLLRGLGRLGVTVPADLSPKSVFDTVLQVLGVGVETLWGKLGQRIGADQVARLRAGIDDLTGAWQFAADVSARGIGALWEHIEGQIGDLWSLVLAAAQDWILGTVVGQATTRLLSMLEPTGVMAVVRSFQAVFAAVQSTVEYIREILEIIDRWASTLAAVAAGDIGPGAAILEAGLAAAIPVALGFLAKQIGIDDLPEQIGRIIVGLRHLVDEALDWLFDRALALGQSALSALGMHGQPDRPAEERPPEPVHEEFVVNGELHELYSDSVTGELWVASTTPKLVKTVSELTSLVEEFRTATRSGRRAKAKALKEQLRANWHLWTVAETLPKTGHAPNIGAVARYQGKQIDGKKSQGPRWRPVYLKGGGEAHRWLPTWELEAEHVIPKSNISEMFVGLGLPEITKDEYKGMHTIMLYRGASARKTYAEDGDNLVLGDLRHRVAEIRQRATVTASEGGPGVLDLAKAAEALYPLFGAFAHSALNRAADAVLAEDASYDINPSFTNGEIRGEPPEPVWSKLNGAFEIEALEAIELLKLR